MSKEGEGPPGERWVESVGTLHCEDEGSQANEVMGRVVDEEDAGSVTNPGGAGSIVGGVLGRVGAGLRALRGLEAGSVALRGGLLLLTFLLAQLVPHFSLLMGLTGSVTGAAMSLILPCVFHLRLRWAALSGWSRMLDLVILTLGTVCSLSGLLCSLHGLLQAVRDG